MIQSLEQLYRFILKVLGLERPEALARQRSDILLYRQEGEYLILERVYPRATARDQMWRISIKGGNPWSLLVALDSAAGLRESLGKLQVDASDPMEASAQRIIKELPTAQFLLSFVWQYRLRYPSRYPRSQAPAQRTEVLFMEPIDLTGVRKQTHPAVYQAFLHKLMLAFLQFALELKPGHQDWKQRLSSIDWMARLEAIAQHPNVNGPHHQLQPVVQPQVR